MLEKADLNFHHGGKHNFTCSYNVCKRKTSSFKYLICLTCSVFISSAFISTSTHWTSSFCKLSAFCKLSVFGKHASAETVVFDVKAVETEKVGTDVVDGELELFDAELDVGFDSWAVLHFSSALAIEHWRSIIDFNH